MDTQSEYNDAIIALLMKIFREAHGTGVLTLETEKTLVRILMPHLFALYKADLAAGTLEAKD